jgi:hypothetical protein
MELLKCVVCNKKKTQARVVYYCDFCKHRFIDLDCLGEKDPMLLWYCPTCYHQSQYLKDKVDGVLPEYQNHIPKIDDLPNFAIENGLRENWRSFIEQSYAIMATDVSLANIFVNHVKSFQSLERFNLRVTKEVKSKPVQYGIENDEALKEKLKTNHPSILAAVLSIRSLNAIVVGS